MRFMAKNPKLEFHRVEWRLWHELLLTGTVDATVVDERHPDGTVKSVRIVDWKSCKRIHDKYKEKWLPPLQHLENSKLMPYYLQLNIYARMIEDNYGIAVSRMDILCMNKQYRDYQYIPVPWMREETALLFRERERDLVQLLGGGARKRDLGQLLDGGGARKLARPAAEESTEERWLREAEGMCS